MKILMFDTEYFWYDTFSKTLDHVEDTEKEEKIADNAVVFIHVEVEDEERKNKVVKSAVKSLKWYLNKVNKEKIVLHSFAHLSSSTSSPEFAAEVISEIKEKLENKGIEVHTTPFGYFSEFSIHVRGESLAKVFKEI
ncbi:threonyl-tRNA synthetase editing domain-containing protein [Methanococcoides orientis]|uniref:threonyl-tRNA synthetase editing domain-containing protein n=1 Tax=Methanococcoides orientis TaxID=2822137 RepID=UPI001E51D654|nr:threonyl-tRNA synthetase editing domain-containing protein [Methanococcoides orientis]UGV40769.1 threonyl-tRNA synthetase editing domain-containing protein [Methanococcoides orientis]